MMKDFYYILGTTRNATPRELDEAYRKLAYKLQPANDAPDHFLDSHFREITEAYEYLSNPTRRRRYDRLLKKSQQGRFYWFRIRHLDIAATLAFVLFTGLFGWYVSRVLSAEKIKKTTVIQPVATLAKPKHHRKKHLPKTAVLAAAEIQLPHKKELESAPPSVKPAAIISTPPAVHMSKPTMVAAVVPTPVVQQHTAIKPVPAAPVAPAVSRNINELDNATYTAELKANVTGVIALHEMPNYTSAVLTNIPNHAQALVLEKGERFYKVKFNGQTGWVAKWTVAAQ